jgi:PAS domain S-box-containing protein
MHTNRRNFDAEDDRLMTSLGKFASVAYQATSAIEDLTSQVAAREAAEARVRELAQGLQAKLRCLVDASIIGIFIWNAAGQIIEANDAFLRLVGSRREDVISGRVSWRELTPVEWQDVDEQRIVDLKASGIARPFEKEFFRKDGTRVPILMGAAVFDDTQDEGVAFVIDLTDRKRAEEAARASDLRYNELRMELAHANRVATLGQLSASIAHEVNQPLSGIVTNASTCLRMLAADVPNIEGARGTARRIIRDSNRAADVIVRLRTLFSKRDAATESIDLNGAIKEATALARSELDRNNVILGHELAEMLPSVAGNRVQLQQVILNLLMNASQAMSSVDDRPRQLVIKTERDEYGRVRVTMRDAGVGLDPRTADKLFDPFYTTKNDGMGIGLSVSRSIIESLGGQIWIGANDGPGATVSFSIPI